MMCILDLRPLNSVHHIGIQTILCSSKDYMDLIESGQDHLLETLPSVLKNLYEAEREKLCCKLSDMHLDVCLSYRIFKKAPLVHFCVPMAHFVVKKESGWELVHQPLLPRLKRSQIDPKSDITLRDFDDVNIELLESVKLFGGFNWEDTFAAVIFTHDVSQMEVKAKKSVFPCFGMFLETLLRNIWEELDRITETDARTVIHNYAIKYLKHYESIKLNLPRLIKDVLALGTNKQELPFRSLLKDWIDIISPIYELVDIVIEEPFISISAILPMINAMKERVSMLNGTTIRFKGKSMDPYAMLIEQVNNTFLEIYKFNPLSSHDIGKQHLVIASFLDPRYKVLQFLDKSQKDAALTQFNKRMEPPPYLRDELVSLFYR